MQRPAPGRYVRVPTTGEPFDAFVPPPADALLALVNADRDRIAGLGRAATSALAVHHAMQRQPIATAAALVSATGLTAATVNKSLAHLESLAVVGELTNRQRGRVFSYTAYVQELARELEPGQ